jgi:iron complex outermembrane recepter protein
MKAIYPSKVHICLLSVLALASADSNAQGGVLEEVVVTAEKRETNVQDTAVVVSAFSGIELDRMQVVNVLDLQKNVPNLLISKGAVNTPIVTMRGVGRIAVSGTASPGVGIHVNGVPVVDGRFFETEFYDTERIEALRGPQGTLYGRNTVGGVLNFISAKPEADLGGEIDIQLGNYNTRRVRGVLNLPLTGNLSTRLAGFSLQRDGYTENLHDGNDVDDRDMFSLRWTTSLQMGEATDATFMLHYFEEDDQRARGDNQSCKKDPAGVLGCLPGLGDEHLHSGATIYGFVTSTFGGGSFPVDDYANSARPSGLREVSMDYSPSYYAEETIATLEFNHDFGELKLTSLTGYVEGNFDASYDGDTTVASEPWPVEVTMALPNGQAPITVDRMYVVDQSALENEQWSQEFRLASSFEGDLNFLLGLFWLDYEAVEDRHWYNSATAWAGQLLGLSEREQIFGADIDPFEENSAAVFGELYWSLTDRLDLTLGLRYSDEEKKIRQRTILLNWLSQIDDEGGWDEFESDWQETTGKLNLSYHLSEDSLLYGTLSRSYKSGGFNHTSSGSGYLDPEVGGDPDNAFYDPEFINSAEVGIKSRMLENSLQVNLTGFYYDYEDMQVTDFLGGDTYTNNTDAEIMGVEGEFVFAPNERWLLQANVAWLATEIKDFQGIDPTNPNQMGTSEGKVIIPTVTKIYLPCGCAGVPTDLSGNELANSPEWSVNLQASYGFSLSNGMGLNLAASYYWQDNFYASMFNLDHELIDDWGIASAWMTLTSANDSWYAEAFVKNIADDENITGQGADGQSFGLASSQFLMEPRTYGITLGYQF